LKDNEVVVGLNGMASLGWRKQNHTHYMGTEDPDGTIHLVPAVLQGARLKKSPIEGGMEFKRTREPLEILRDYFPDAKELTE